MSKEIKQKEVKQSEKKGSDTELDGFSYDEFFQNQLSLSSQLKEELRKKGLEWRFISGKSFRSKGFHRSRWMPYNVTDGKAMESLKGVSPEGIITRGDLILAVREKHMGDAHRKFLAQRSGQYKNFNKQKAQELRGLAKSAGIDDAVAVHEGYEDNWTNSVK